MAPEADHDLVEVGGRFATCGGSEVTLNDLQPEFALWGDAPAGDCLTGELSAVDLTVYPSIALLLRVAARGTDFDKKHFIGPRRAAWIDRMQTLPIVQRPGRGTGITPLRLDWAGRAPRWRTERTIREPGRSPTGTSE